MENKSNKKKVWLSIKGDLDSGETENEQTVFSTEGELYRDGAAYCLSYDESAVSGMGNTRTTVRVEGDKVTVIRLGDVNSVMEFERGQSKMNMYETPYGELSMRLFTRDIQIGYDETAAMLKSVKVDYEIEIRGLISGSNTIDIEINSEFGVRNSELWRDEDSRQ